ncbi:MAG TPA: LysR family transcriptional regulator [Myxococcaceae bacterium]|jgi:DNA-binding transcriptional LysR family regulator
MTSNDLGLLATLDALLQEGSVTGAARRLGLSTPAMSHALARMREKLGDPLLVRAGRGMVLTPRAEALRPRVHTLVSEANQALEPPRPFVPAELVRAFVIHATDYVLAVLGLAVDRILQREAPGIALRFIPNTLDDPAQLRGGGSDLAVGIYGDLPQEMRSRMLLTDRFVCVVRKGHPLAGKRLTLEQFVQRPHIQVAPRGAPGGYLDDVLRERGLQRNVARAVPYFLTALQMAARTDHLLTISERVAAPMADSLGLKLLEPPLPLRPYALSLVWHPRFDGDAGHRFLREAFVRAAHEEAGDVHADARTRLEPPRRRR